MPCLVEFQVADAYFTLCLSISGLPSTNILLQWFKLSFFPKSIFKFIMFLAPSARLLPRIHNYMKEFQLNLDRKELTPEIHFILVQDSVLT